MEWEGEEEEYHPVGARVAKLREGLRSLPYSVSRTCRSEGTLNSCKRVSNYYWALSILLPLMCASPSLCERARAVALDILPILLSLRHHERSRLATLLDACHHDHDAHALASALCDLHLPFLAAPFGDYTIPPDPDRSALELHWRCAVELTAFDDASLARLNHAFFAQDAPTPLVSMQRLLPVFSQLAVPRHTSCSTTRSSSDALGEKTLSDSYAKWHAFQDDDDEEEPPDHELDTLWCGRHQRLHKGQCPKCSGQAASSQRLAPAPSPPLVVDTDDLDSLLEQAKTLVDTPGCLDAHAISRGDDILLRCQRVLRRMPRFITLREVTDRLERRLKDDRRQTDVVHHLQAKIEDIPDDEISFEVCFDALRKAESHMPAQYASTFRQARHAASMGAN